MRKARAERGTDKRKAAKKAGDRSPVNLVKGAKRRAAKSHAEPRHESLTDAILETAKDMHDIGMLNKANYDKITMRHPKWTSYALVNAKVVTPPQIRKMREQAHMSQGVFAKVLNITPGYVSQLERGDKQPTGATLALLNVIKRKGIEPLL